MMETEEILESRLVALIEKAVPGAFVIGMMEPVERGVVKSAPDTHIAVAVDLASQDMDWTGPAVPCVHEARVSVNCSLADDPSGTEFRDTCRAVRSALCGCAGDGCASLSGDGLVCDAAILNSTATAFSDGDANDVLTKTYSLTIHSRTTNKEL